MLTSLSMRFAMALSASSFDSENFSRAMPISSSVMFLPEVEEGAWHHEDGGVAP